MKNKRAMSTTVLAATLAALVGGGAGIANATEPCDDFGECRALVEINASDGDIGFHFLMDGDALIYGALFNPKHRKIFTYYPRRELRRQTSTELFQESAEPPCSVEVAEEGDDVVTLKDFIHRWDDGTYYFSLGDIGDDRSIGVIQQALQDPDPTVRERALEVINEINDDAAFRALYPPE